MSPHTHENGLGLHNGLVVLRDIVTPGNSVLRYRSFVSSTQNASSHSSALRVICVDAHQLIEE